MKQLILISLSILTLLANTQAQPTNDFDIVSGPVEEEKRSTFIKTVCSYQDYYIVLRQIKSKYSLEKLNDHLMAIKAIDVTEFEESDGKKREFTNVIAVNDKIYLITTKTIKKKSSTTYFQEIDPEHFELIGDVKILDETDLTGKKRQKRFIFAGIGMSNLMAEMNDYSSNSMLFSPDDKKILTYNKSFDDRDGPDILSIKVQNTDFSVDWENDSIALPYNTLLFDIERVRVDNNADILLSGVEYFEKRKSKVDNLPNYKYHLLRITNKGKSIRDYDIKLSGKFITDCQFEILDSATVVVTGFYSESDASAIKGAFYIKLDIVNNKVLSENMKDFSFEFIVSGLTERQKEKVKKKEEKGKEVELLDFYLDDIIVNDNGTISMIAEQFDIVSYQTYVAGMNGQPGRWETHYKYYYNDIIVVNFSETGTINWTTKVNKVQVTTDDGGYYSSYAHTMKDNNLYLVYNDHPDNLNETDVTNYRSYRRGRETSQLVVKIDAEGKMTKEELFKSEKGEVILRPKAGIRSENGDLMLYSNRSKEYQFSLIKFK